MFSNTSMSFRSPYSIQKETDVTQRIIPLNYKTTWITYVTATLCSVTFVNLCNAPSFGDATSLLMLVQTLQTEQLPETHSTLPPGSWQPLSPAPGRWLLVTYQCQVLHDICWFMLVARARMTTRAAQRTDLCPPLPELGVESRCTFPPLPAVLQPTLKQSQLDMLPTPPFLPSWRPISPGSSCLSNNRRHIMDLLKETLWYFKVPVRNTFFCIHFFFLNFPGMMDILTLKELVSSVLYFQRNNTLIDSL